MDDYRIQSVRIIGDCRLVCTLHNGEDRTVDLEGLISVHRGFVQLRDPAFFARVAISNDGLNLLWPGDIDIGITRLFSPKSK